MKRLLATTAVLGLMAAAPAWADHDTWTILQDFDITSPGDQDVVNTITGGNVGVEQSGNNLANSFSIVDPGEETGVAGDSYTVEQIFDEDQTVDNTVTATGHVTAQQSGTNIVNLGQITDPLGDAENGETYDIEQLASFGVAESGSQVVSNVIGGGATGISDSSQGGTNQVNALTITDSVGGETTAGTLTVNQQVADAPDDAFVQSVTNSASACCIDGLDQSGSTKANLLTLGLTNQDGGLTVDVTQDTSDAFNQSVVNTATAGGSAMDVTQSGSNAANVITVPTP